ncbi:MAG TPA: glutathione peroxidase [Chitinophagaceae bacterium]|nr:glutathione peroxidase [Chitinophagaceae bacterium]
MRFLKNEKSIRPPESFYSLSTQLNNGKELRFDSLKGRKVLIVNTASDCGYTNQYDELQKLFEGYKDTLMVIGFPANDFKDQEKGSDEEIAQFCRVNFGVTFPIARKDSVIKGKSQQIVFQWLTDKSKNGWNSKPPRWNFSKYLINEQGILTHYFDSAISPLGKEISEAINETH